MRDKLELRNTSLPDLLPGPKVARKRKEPSVHAASAIWNARRLSFANAFLQLCSLSRAASKLMVSNDLFEVWCSGAKISAEGLIKQALQH